MGQGKAVPRTMSCDPGPGESGEDNVAVPGQAGRGTGLTVVQSPGLCGVPEGACDQETAPAATKEGFGHPVAIRPELQGDCDLGGGHASGCGGATPRPSALKP